VIGVSYLVFLTVSIFVTDLQEPLSVILSQAMIKTSGSPDNAMWTIIAFKITGFACAIIFIFLGTYISYYKSVIKVDAMQLVLKGSFYCLCAYATISFLHTTFVIMFAGFQEIDWDTNGKRIAALMIAILLQVVFYLLGLLCFIVPYRQVKKTLALMIKYHDYLI